MKMLRKTLLPLWLAAVSAGGFACAGAAMTEDETLVGEASSALTVAEETGDVTADVAGVESDAALAAHGEDAAALPAAGDADGVCDLGARRARVLARYDANDNGRLEASERQALKADLEARVGHPLAVRFGLAHRAHVMRRLHWVFDFDDDGALSSDERTAMVDALEARCQRLRAEVLTRFDGNGDGALDATEKQAAKDAFLARVQAARQQVLRQYDLDGNGVLDDGERTALRDERVAAYRARRAAVIAQFDANGDGGLDDTEKLALRRALEQRLVEGRDAQ